MSEETSTREKPHGIAKTLGFERLIDWTVHGPNDDRRHASRTSFWGQVNNARGETVRFKWNPGDIAFWDNRSTAHLAPRDIFQSDFDRQLYRITLIGEPLVGVDGRTSNAIEGLPILSAAEELKLMAAAE